MTLPVWPDRHQRPPRHEFFDRPQSANGIARAFPFVVPPSCSVRISRQPLRIAPSCTAQETVSGGCSSGRDSQSFFLSFFLLSCTTDAPPLSLCLCWSFCSLRLIALLLLISAPLLLATHTHTHSLSLALFLLPRCPPLPPPLSSMHFPAALVPRATLDWLSHFCLACTYPFHLYPVWQQLKLSALRLTLSPSPSFLVFPCSVLSLSNPTSHSAAALHRPACIRLALSPPRSNCPTFSRFRRPSPFLLPASFPSPQHDSLHHATSTARNLY